MARPIRDVGSAGRRESVAGARCRRGFEETWQFLSVFLVRRSGNFAGFADPDCWTLVQCDFEIDIPALSREILRGEGIARRRLTHCPLLCYPAVFATKISLHFSPTPTHRRWFLSLCRRRVIFEQELAEETEFLNFISVRSVPFC